MLVSARNVENGLKGFYSGAKTHRRFAGNCLTLNNDGDGGVGLSYYQPNEFLLDTHVYALYPKKNNFQVRTAVRLAFNLDVPSVFQPRALHQPKPPENIENHASRDDGRQARFHIYG